VPNRAAAAQRNKLESHLGALGAGTLLRADLARGAWLDALVPELRTEMDFPQRTHYHAYSILEHSLRTMVGMPADPEERLLGLLHDIGKHRCVSIKERTGEEQFLGHGAVGARLIVPILGRLGYEDAFIERMSRRIYYHMELHIASNNGLSARAQAKLLGKIEPDLAVLERLQIADINAMNPKLAPAMRASALGYHRILAETIAVREANRTTDCGPAHRHQGSPAGFSPYSRPLQASAPTGLRLNQRQPAETPDELIGRYGRAGGRAAHPALVVITGLPGAGKTYLSERLVVELGFVRVSSDDIRMALTGGSPSYAGNESFLTHQTVRRIVAALLAQGSRVVADSTGLVPSERRETIALGRAAGIPVTLVWCKVEDDLAVARLARRATERAAYDRSEADAGIRARMANRATAPSAHEADLVITWTPPIEEPVWAKLCSFLRPA